MLLEPKDVKGINVGIKPSPLLSEDLMKAAQAGNPSLWASSLQESGGSWNAISQGQAEYWGESRAALAARAAVAFGVPSNLLIEGAPVNFLDDVVDFAMTTPLDAAQLGIKFAQMGISIVTKALSPIPIVGLIAQAVGGIVNVILGLNEKDPIERMEVFPEPQDYVDAIDATVAETVRMQMNESDWNRLFAPRFKSSFESQRRGAEGKLLMFIGTESSDGIGYVPGTQRIIGGVQVGPIGNSGSVQTRAQNLGEWYPTAAQLMTAMWGQVNDPGPYMYFVNANKVRDTWDDYVSAAIEYVNDHLTPRDAGDVAAGAAFAETIEVAELKAAIRPFFKATFDSGSGFARQDQDYRGLRRQTIFQAYVKPAMKKLRQRQEHYLGKLTLAYIDLEGAAFQDKALKAKAIENRKILLTHPARFEVRLSDVIDLEYRAALVDAGVRKIPQIPGGFTIAPRPFVTGVPDATPGPIEGGAPGAFPPGKKRRNILPYVVVGAGLGYLGYKALKRRRVL